MMADVLTTLVKFPLVWTLLTLGMVRAYPRKATPGIFLGAFAVSVGFTTLVLGAPSTEGILSAILLWPLIGAVVVVSLPRQWSEAIRRVSSVWLWAGFILSLYLLGPVVSQALAPDEASLANANTLVRAFYNGICVPFFGTFTELEPYGASTVNAGYSFLEDATWIESFGIHYKLGIDGLSLWLVILTTLLTPIALDVSWNSINTKLKEYAFAFLMLQVGMVGAFVALDLFLFYVFWELMLVPMYLIIGVWGGKDRVYAAVKFFIYTMVGSLVMLLAILYVVMQYRDLHPEHVMTFDLIELTSMGSSTFTLARPQQIVLFFAFGLAFAIKVPMFPFHTWLPDAHVQAPTGGSVILAAVLLKLGCYGFLRFSVPLFPWAMRFVSPTLAGVAVFAIIYGAYCAWVQKDVKKLVAYSSVSHLGFVMVGLFSMTTGGVSGSILQMVSHGVSTGALFILVGVIYDRRHSRELSEFGGLAKVMPVYATLFVIVAMSSIGLPGTNGFIGEFMILAGAFGSSVFEKWQKLLTIFAATGVVLAAIYMLHAVLKTFWGPLTNEKNKDLPDLSGREKWILAPLIILIFWIGLFPGFFLNAMEPSVEAYLQTWNSRSATAASEARLVIRPPAPAAPAEQDDAEGQGAPAEGADARAPAQPSRQAIARAERGGAR